MTKNRFRRPRTSFRPMKNRFRRPVMSLRPMKNRFHRLMTNCRLTKNRFRRPVNIRLMTNCRLMKSLRLTMSLPMNSCPKTNFRLTMNCPKTNRRLMYRLSERVLSAYIPNPLTALVYFDFLSHYSLTHCRSGLYSVFLAVFPKRNTL